MKWIVPALTIACSVSLIAADEIAQRVSDDARVIRRIAEVSRRDFPEDLVSRILKEDLDLLRGRRANGSYAYAHFEREEAGRDDDRFAVKSQDENRPDSPSFAAEGVYRVMISVPSRRLLVAKNRRVFIDRVEVEYTPFEGSRTEKTYQVKSWLAVGEAKNFDLPEIAKRAKARVYAHVESRDGGPATIEIALLEPKLVDTTNSPYAGAVRTLKSLQNSVDKREVAQVKAASTRIIEDLGFSSQREMPRSSHSEVTVTATPVPPMRSSAPVTLDLEAMPQVEVYLELQRIEDLLTGSEGERREGMDALHQLVRKLRTR